MRIVSLLSSATEIVFELGLGDHLVGISHECDYPPEALHLPRLSRSRFDPAGMDSGEIDRAVRRCMEEFGSVYEIDIAELQAARPDLILTQGVCEVCAVPTGSVEDAVEQLAHRPQVASLDAHTLDGIFQTVQQVADAAEVPERGVEAVGRLRSRIERVGEQLAADGGTTRTPTLALEWLDPPFVPGHWVPEMIRLAGGESLLGTAGGHSHATTWKEIPQLDGGVLLLLPCGYDLRQARGDAERHRERLEAVAAGAISAGRAWIGHGAYFSRSGPRVVDGIEALAGVLHPDRFPGAPVSGRVEPWQ